MANNNPSGKNHFEIRSWSILNYRNRPTMWTAVIFHVKKRLWNRSYRLNFTRVPRYPFLRRFVLKFVEIFHAQRSRFRAQLTKSNPSEKKPFRNSVAIHSKLPKPANVSSDRVRAFSFERGRSRRGVEKRKPEERASRVGAVRRPKLAGVLDDR